MGLEQYRKKRDFSRTPEPAGSPGGKQATVAKVQGLGFVVQKHAASRLHYDFRLELDGVLKSWAVPKGPSLDPHEKRLAVQVEDHPIEYGDFEGIIPTGQYGGGTVLLWDRGLWASFEGDAAESFAKGKLKLVLMGEKLRGGWTLVRMHGPRAGERGENWLLIKENDDTAQPGSGDALVRDQAASVLSGQTIEQIAADPPRVWQSNGSDDADATKEDATKHKHAAPTRRTAPVAAKAASATRNAAGTVGTRRNAAGAAGARRSTAGAAGAESVTAGAAGGKHSAAEATGAKRGTTGPAGGGQGRTGSASARPPASAGGKAKRATAKTTAKAAADAGKDASQADLAALAAAVPGARRAAMPAAIEPQLATLASEPPEGDSWLHEIKLDGYRALCELRRGKVRLLTRRGKDWSDRFAAVAAAAADLPVESAILDGEVTVLQADGTTSFQALQEALGDGGGQPGSGLVYFVFDLLYLDGWDLRAAPLLARKDLLRQLLAAGGGGAAAGAAGGPPTGDQGGTAAHDTLRFSDHVAGQGQDVFRAACSHQLEGIVSKRADRAWHAGRGPDWLKVKCHQRQEVVIGGFTDPQGTRAGLGALLMGVFDGKKLVYCGKVGTGFSASALLDLHRQLKRLERASPPFDNPPRGAEARGAHWIEPKLVAEVAFAEWTRDGHLRQPSFLGLREDKPAQQVVRERPAAAPAADPDDQAAATGSRKSADAKAPAGKTAPQGSGGGTGDGGSGRGSGAGGGGRASTGKAAAVEIAGVKLTHPERVLYPGIGLTKRDLALFYERIADWALPQLTGRPLSLVRCPDGQAGQCFYQKHISDQFPASVNRVPIEEGGKTVLYPMVDSPAGLVALVQMGVLETHVWGAHADQVERPDYAVFDLDPDEGLPWEPIAEAALELRDLLAAGGLTSFLKTTGGKGLHVVLPLARRQEWDDLKLFCRTVAEALATARPDRYTANPLKARRKGRIYVDYLRNGRGSTSIAAYSCRARPGAPVSTPLAWDELDGPVRANTYTVENLPQRLEKLAADPWQDIATVRQSITAAIKRRWGVPET
jgi:bifunctional non-homologous end joining protein LigD